MLRVRTRDARKVVAGTYRTRYSTITSSGLHGSYQKTTDVVGHRELDNQFLSDRQTRLFGTLDGQTHNGERVWSHYPLWGLANRPMPSISYTKPNFQQLAPLWLGSLTPHAQAISIPAFVGEAKDLPSLLTQFPQLILDWGRRRLSKNASTAAKASKLLADYGGDAGSLYLGYQFGWSPLMRDLASMLGILKAVKRNIEMLERLRSGRTIKRSLRLPPQKTVSDLGYVTLESSGTIIRALVTRVSQNVQWVSTRWEPLFPGMYQRMSDEDLLAKALREATGFTPGALLDTWWELLPWSWLIDWFGKVQGHLALGTRNTYLVRCVSFCWMCTAQVHEYFAKLPMNEGLRYSGQDLLHRITKERVPLAPTVVSPNDPSHPSLPVLSGGQMGILAALLAQAGSSIKRL